MRWAAPFVLILYVLILNGCSNEPVEKENRTEPRMVVYSIEETMDMEDPGVCKMIEESVDEKFALKYIKNIQKLEDDLLFTDICLIHNVQIELNDNTITKCNEASDNIYRFLEEGHYDIPAWEFCFRKGFGEYKSVPKPPERGEIRKLETCENLRGFKDNCYYVAAMNGNEAACNRIESGSMRELCIT